MSENKVQNISTTYKVRKAVKKKGNSKEWQKIENSILNYR
jgi:hypothetical protein